MDTTLDKDDLWSLETFKRVGKCVRNLCRSYDLSLHAIIPSSAVTAGNIGQRADESPWYNGPTIVETLGELADMNLYEETEETSEQYETDRLKIKVMYVANCMISPGMSLVVHSCNENIVTGVIQKQIVIISAKQKTKLSVNEIKMIKRKSKHFIMNSHETPSYASVTLSLSAPITVRKGDRIVLRDSERTIGLARVSK